jgi:hypothetical protein
MGTALPAVPPPCFSGPDFLAATWSTTGRLTRSEFRPGFFSKMIFLNALRCWRDLPFIAPLPREECS